ncbi:MAG: glycoside hydrolase family 38 N-terminal domain-containing protein [Fimbriimonadaceae bacterium]
MPSPKLTSAMRAAAAAFVLFTNAPTHAQTTVKRDLSKGNTLFVVPYAHLDTQWRWAYPQVIREFIPNTLTRNFALIDKYPHYVFNFSGARRYEMMKEYYPEDFQRLKGYVEAGRWFPCGSSIDECDANVPAAESIIRHVLYGNRFFRREFGVASHEFMLPDCFGFPYALPSILAHCGILGFSTQKLTWGSSATGPNGIPFKVGVWEGPDGRSVVAALDPGSYGADVTEDLSENTSWLARIQNTGKISGAYVDYHYYGTGDTGGAPRASSVEWMEKSVAGTGPITVVSSKADEMFNALTRGEIAKLPRYKGELLLTAHSAGSISSESYMKRSNRKSELLADGAEKASVAAMILGATPYPGDRLYHAWDLVLGSQMHDMLPGTSIPKAYEFCWNDFLLAQNQFAAVETDAVGAVAKQMDTRGKGVSLVVYNPLSISRTDPVKATIPDISRGGAIAVSGPDGRQLPAQVLSRKGGAVTISFEPTVPATGFAAFVAHPVARRADIDAALKVDSRHLENHRFRVTINNAGDIASIYDKQAKREVLKAPSRLELQYENPSQFPAWNMDWADAKLPPRDIVGGPARIHVVENGPVRVALEIEREAKGSKFVQQVRLAANGDRIEVLNTIDWKTKERALKASFPLTTGNPEATYDLQLGTIKRGNDNPKKYEVPQHQWFDLTKPDGSYGVGILNDCKFASDKPNDDEMRLTLIYTPGTRAGFADQGTQDFGRHQILYAIAPHRGDWRKGEVPWQAQRLNQPLRVFRVSPHPGALGKRFSLLSTSSDHVEVQALKKAEDGDEVVVRLRELTGSPARGVRIRFARPVLSAREVTGQELPLGPARVVGGDLLVDVPGYSLKAFAVKFGAARGRPEAIQTKPVTLPYDVDVVSAHTNPGDGEFANGQALSAEQLPATLPVDDVTFKLGPKADGKKNAVAAHGQKITIPAGCQRLYILAAADGDVTATFKVGTRSVPTTIQSWRGYVGQWDNRQWAGDPGPNFTNYGEMDGLTPGYVKHSEVAWFASHTHTPNGNTYYQYSYLYKYGFDIPKGVRSFTLPNDSRIKVMALSVSRDGHDDAIAAAPLYDTLADHVGGSAPTIAPSGGVFNDATEVSVDPPLYFHAGGIHYTLDGSKPSASSPLYTGPFTLNDPATVKVAQVDASGRVGAVARATIEVHDTTPPSVISGNLVKAIGIAKIVFSEPVEQASAQTVGNYTFAAGANVTAASLAPDRRTVELTLDRPLNSAESAGLAIHGVKDLAHTPNVAVVSVNLTSRGAVFTSPPLTPGVARVFSSIPGLPVHGGDAWTLNLFCEVDKQPEDRTMIAGFGRSIDGRVGTGRYFTKFPEGINFWVADRDVQTQVPLDLGKWQMLTATYDGTTMRLYKNGELIGEKQVALADDRSLVRVLPIDAWERRRRFGGEVRNVTVWDMDLPPEAVKRLWEADSAK